MAAHPYTPFRCLYHMHSLWPKHSTKPSLSSTHWEAKSHHPKSQNFIFTRESLQTQAMFQGKNKPELLRCATAQQKMNDLSKMTPGLKIQEVPQLLLSLLLPPQEHAAPLPSQRITVCLASHTQRGFVWQNVCQRDRELIVR